mgnify:FL=1
MLNADAANWGAKTGYLFAGLGFLSCIAVWLWIPEYSGRSYAQLDELFARGVPARQFRNTETTGEYGKDVEHA